MDKDEILNPVCSKCNGTGITLVKAANKGNVEHGKCWQCGAKITYRNGSMITVYGINANEVQEVSLTLIEQTKPHHTSPNPWTSGSFYLIVFVIVIVVLSVVGHLLPIFALPTVLIGGIIALSVIGALQMRQDQKLSEKNFLKLMALSFKYLPWLRRRDTKYAKQKTQRKS